MLLQYKFQTVKKELNTTQYIRKVILNYIENTKFGINPATLSEEFCHQQTHWIFNISNFQKKEVVV